MVEYRLYCLDGANHIAAGEWLEAKSDNEALAFARSKKLRVPSELWRSNRLVARIEAYSGA